MGSNSKGNIRPKAEIKIYHIFAYSSERKSWTFYKAVAMAPLTSTPPPPPNITAPVDRYAYKIKIFEEKVFYLHLYPYPAK